MQFGKEGSLTVNGKSYRFSRLTTEIEEKFLDWANKKLGNPVEKLIKEKTLEGFPPHLQELLLQDAINKRDLRNHPQSPEIQQLKTTPAGSRKLFALMLEKYQPDLTEEEVGELIDNAIFDQGPEAISEAILVAQGKAGEAELKKLRRERALRIALEKEEEKKSLEE